jgi:histidinol phosphatase-like PHP family hydrolase
MGEFDFVIGSANYAEGMQAGWKPAFFEQPLRPAYEAYFRQVVRLATQGDCDVMGQPEPCPALEILRWYRQLGGEILIFGSDAHKPQDIGMHFKLARELALTAGFTRLARFERRQIHLVSR